MQDGLLLHSFPYIPAFPYEVCSLHKLRRQLGGCLALASIITLLTAEVFDGSMKVGVVFQRGLNLKTNIRSYRKSNKLLGRWGRERMAGRAGRVVSSPGTLMIVNTTTKSKLNQLITSRQASELTSRGINRKPILVG